MERGRKPCCLTAFWLIEIEVGIRQRRHRVQILTTEKIKKRQMRGKKHIIGTIYKFV